ncbi:hypothetical protein L9F63_013845, partial [Diploptera punctata]
SLSSQMPLTSSCLIISNFALCGRLKWSLLRGATVLNIPIARLLQFLTPPSALMDAVCFKYLYNFRKPPLSISGRVFGYLIQTTCCYLGKGDNGYLVRWTYIGFMLVPKSVYV